MLFHIIAKHKKTDKTVDMEFKSIKEAKKYNKGLKDYRIVSFADKYKTKR